MKAKSALSWVLALLAAVILIQTLFFKFTGAEESIYIFTQVGMEPWGRIASGITELIAAVLLLVPKTRLYGALIGLGVISGAIFFHLTSLGIEINNDGGLLFIYALVVFLSCAILSLLHHKQFPLTFFRNEKTSTF